ncbi:MAG: sodium:proton antiporter [Alphaproteobacteria bacterium]|nr:sodium:proton antiporter [Alphaproteobacteria bacterium]
MLARRFDMPYSAGLVFAGIGLSALPLPIDIPLTKDLVFSLLLPPLIFEAAFHISWKALRKDLLLILFLATVGLLMAAGVTAAGMHYVAGWQWVGALVFGVLISATDPVSVIATLKEAGVQGRLRLLIETESLLNDGTAAVAFNLSLAIAAGGAAMTMTHAGIMLGTSITGGVLSGALVAGAAILFTGKTEDHLVQIAFTTIAAYASFLLADHFHVSGVLATLTAGILLGNFGSLGAFGDKGRESVAAFWEYAAFVVNSLIFILIGMHEAKQDVLAVLYPALTAIGFVILGRATAIYPSCLLFRGSKLKVKSRHQHILFWGGLRGALALALALSLPDDMPNREEIITVAFTVVAFSVFVQGMTMAPLLRAFGEIPAHFKKATRTKNAGARKKKKKKKGEEDGEADEKSPAKDHSPEEKEHGKKEKAAK